MKTKTEPEPASLAEVLAELRLIRQQLGTQAAAVLNREAAAVYIGVSTATLERLTAAAKLRTIRVSEGRVGWTRKGLDAYLAELE